MPVLLAARLRPSGTGTTHGELLRGRLAVALLFLVAGAAVGTLTARLPTIKHDLGLGDSRLSLALLALAAGGLAGMRYAGRYVDRRGATAVVTPAALSLGPALMLIAFAPTLWSLSAVLLAFGMIHGTLNVAMNAAAVTCQHAYQRPIMTSFHALFSIGGVLGAAGGGLFAHAHAGAAATFIAVGAAITAVASWAIRWVLPNAPPRPAGSGPERGRPETTGHGDHPVTVSRRPGSRATLLGLLAFCSLIGEGAAADWSSVYLHDSLGSSAAVAAIAYAVFALLMTGGRLVGDRLVAWLRPVPLLRGCGLLASAGFSAGILAGHPAAAIAGFGCLGAGLSCVVPQVYSAAGNLDPVRAGAGLSRVAALGYLGYVTGPVLIGAVAGQVGLAHALLILPILALFIAAAAAIVRLPTSAAEDAKASSPASGGPG